MAQVHRYERPRGGYAEADRDGPVRKGVCHWTVAHAVLSLWHMQSRLKYSIYGYILPVFSQRFYFSLVNHSKSINMRNPYRVYH